MKPLTKILLTLGVSLLFIGCVMCGVAYIMSGMDLAKLDIDTAYSKKTYTLSSTDIDNIELDVDRHTVFIKQSSSVDVVTVEYAENEYDLFKTEENGNAFLITNKHSQNLYFRQFCLLFDRNNKTGRELTVTIPRRFNGAITIKSSDADVDVTGINLIENLNIELSDGDIVLTSVNCTNAVVSLKTGELSITGGVYENLDVTLANQAEYVPITEVDNLPSATPEESPVASPTVEPTPEPTEPTPEPQETQAPDDPDETAEPTLEPDNTPTAEPTPTNTPAPTKTPTVLTVTACVTLDSVDCKNLKITAYNTNIEGSIARALTYYNVETNNTETSNIASTENINAVGKITINQNGGSTELAFK